MTHEKPEQGNETDSSVVYKGGADGKAKDAKEVPEEKLPGEKEGEKTETQSPPNVQTK